MNTLFGIHLHNSKSMWVDKPENPTMPSGEINFYPSHGVLREEPSRYSVQIPLPGFTKKELSVTLDGMTLQVAAQKTSKGKVTRSPLGTNLYHSVVLPSSADRSTLTAKYRDGLLTIRMNKIKPGSTIRLISVENEHASADLFRHSVRLAHYGWNKIKSVFAQFFSHSPDRLTSE